MLTRKLHQAYKKISSLVDFLLKRDWITCSELCEILELADKEIERIQDKAISDVLAKLQGSYSIEAQLWANNEMTDMLNEVCLISEAEQAKAKTELKRIQKAIDELIEVL